MKIKYIFGISLLLLSGCTAAELATVAAGVGIGSQAINDAVVDGQLFCSIATANGPLVTAIVNAADSKAVVVTGKTAALVSSICAVISGIPVVTPSNPNAVPVTAVNLPN